MVKETERTHKHKSPTPNMFKSGLKGIRKDRCGLWADDGFGAKRHGSIFVPAKPSSTLSQPDEETTIVN